MTKLSSILPLALICVLFLFTKAEAQQGPPEHLREAIRNVETMLQSEGEATLASFVDSAMMPDENRERPELIERLKKMRSATRGLWDGISVEPAPEGVLMTLSGSGEQRQVRIEITDEGIRDLRLLEPPEPMNLSKDSVNATIDRLAKEGMAGVIYLVLDGQVVSDRGFGMANESLNIPNDRTKIFGVGSRPIDFTKAAIFLLEQRGQIDQDDAIDRYFDNVPTDKSSMTIRQLMTGRSGLPDFFHTDEDWDPDLAWIDRETAMQRILSKELLFEPGSDRQHSHAAFGLLAALVEKVSGSSYYAFLKKHFFEPAKMERTKEYGMRGGLSIRDFAVGSGPQQVGLPNIPPNWGPTSWLIKGSGGMYSTLGDLLSFYRFVRSDQLFDDEYREAFSQPHANIDGSERGFELFNAYNSDDRQVFFFLNRKSDMVLMRQLFQELQNLIFEQEG